MEKGFIYNKDGIIVPNTFISTNYFPRDLREISVLSLPRPTPPGRRLCSLPLGLTV